MAGSEGRGRQRERQRTKENCNAERLDLSYITYYFLCGGGRAATRTDAKGFFDNLSLEDVTR